MSTPPPTPSTFLATVHVCSVVSDSLQLYGLQPSRLLCPWDSPGKNTRGYSHFLLQGIFPTQGSNLHLFCLWAANSLTVRSQPLGGGEGVVQGIIRGIKMPLVAGDLSCFQHLKVSYSRKLCT